MENFKDLEDMTPETARRLFFNGATFILHGLPVGSEFGIDYDSWNTGEKFLGVKMVPPGIHFVYFSVVGIANKQQSPRIGFFHNFHEKEILVKKWDKLKEDLVESDASAEEIERYRSNLRDLDQFLAPYPYQSYRTWYSLTNFIRPEVVIKLQPLLEHGRISSQSELVSKEYQDFGQAGQRVDKQHPVRMRFYDNQGLPIMYVKPGTEIRFSRLSWNGALPASSTTKNLSDQIFEQILASCQQLKKEEGDESLESCQSEKSAERQQQQYDDFLGELQFAFVCFILGHLYEAFEQWKRIVRLICSCEQALSNHQTFFLKFLSVLHFQLKLTPTEFFVDIVSKNNFLLVTLTHLFTNVESSSNLCRKGGELSQKCEKFKRYLTKQYKWNFDTTPDDCEPVIVDT